MAGSLMVLGLRDSSRFATTFGMAVQSETVVLPRSPGCVCLSTNAYAQGKAVKTEKDQAHAEREYYEILDRQDQLSDAPGRTAMTVEFFRGERKVEMEVCVRDFERDESAD